MSELPRMPESPCTNTMERSYYRDWSIYGSERADALHARLRAAAALLEELVTRISYCSGSCGGPDDVKASALLAQLRGEGLL